MRIYRLTVKQTVEERILELQDAKRKLAAAAIEGGSKAIAKLSMRDILQLFKREAEWDNRFEDKHGDDHAHLFAKRKVLGSGHDETLVANDTRGDVEVRKVSGKRPTPPRAEHPVYGRR